MSRNTDYIPFALPSLDNREEDAVLRVLRSGWLTTGKECSRFEEEFAAYTGAPFALAVNSATAGLHLALEALEIPEGSWVVTSPYTFTATAEVIRYRRAHPLFADIRPEDFNIDPLAVEAALKNPDKKNISAILPVHVAGKACAMDEIAQSAKKARLPLVEDAAHAFPLQINNTFLGTGGTIGVFSFYATKTMTTGEGGMIVCRDENLAKTMRCLRLHGIDRDVWNRYQGERASWEYDVLAPGYKYNLTDLAAAMGRVQLQKARDFFLERKKIARFYTDNLAEIPGLILPEFTGDHAWHLYIIRLDGDVLGLTRDQFINQMAENGIGCSVHYKPLHLMTYYKKMYNLKPEDFPNASRVFREAISLPIYPGLTGAQLERIAETVRKILNGRAGKPALSGGVDFERN